MLRPVLARFTLTATFLTAVACTASTSVVTTAIPPKLKGDWRGTLVTANAPDSADDFEWRSPTRFRLVISDSSRRVYVWNEETWREIKPGTFGITVFDTSAVVTSITRGIDEDGVWVETWSFALTVIDSNHVRAMFQRQVNNKDMKRNDPGATWGHVAFGVLERGSDADV